ncbi:hypothetical protein M514_00256 [Trichuris suis]|uniref:ISXO2-like transposase domain-containing protein n=1 Tax=Trichuris suis TaxID=68888 RepID=A0A085MPE7_9BILA|nr:hypothetical protein M513_00256 [Trichuris suis]KFD67856.1 hypothetical protein M514_00256 [Trichuris suis]
MLVRLVVVVCIENNVQMFTGAANTKHTFGTEYSVLDVAVIPVSSSDNRTWIIPHVFARRDSGVCNCQTCVESIEQSDLTACCAIDVVVLDSRRYANFVSYSESRITFIWGSTFRIERLPIRTADNGSSVASAQNPECFLVLIGNHGSEMYIPVICQYVRPGSTVISDEWRGYLALSDEDSLTCVNQPIGFIHLVTRKHAQTV